MTTHGAVEIAELAHHLELAPLLAAWHVAEWEHLYRGWDLAAAEAELRAMDTPGRIPTTWVAFDGPGRSPGDVVGSVSLIDDDELERWRDVGPWLASLYVVPRGRGRGTGRILVRHLVEQARHLGVTRLHLFTAGQEAYYADLGWRVIDRTPAGDETAAVMVLDTDPAAPRRALVTQWCTDPGFRTAYSYLRPGGSPADRDRLAGPVAPGLRLAGEAASSAFPGTMHGAWFSGEQAAGAVLAEQSPATAIVVGAGLAGIAAARRLQEAGVHVTVLERAAEPGGRTRTDTSLGGPLNLGAAWVHGDEGNPVAVAAEALGIGGDTSVWGSTGTFVPGHGHLAAADATRLGTAFASVEAAITAARDDGGDGALGPVARRLVEEAAETPLDRTVLSCWVRGEFENLYAAPLDDLSLIHCAEPFRLPGDDVMLLGSTTDIVEHLARGLAVRCGDPVTAVRRRGDQWEVATARTLHVADGVVVTVPVGVLQAGSLSFDPPLPAGLLASLGRIGAGRVAKVFVTFDERFWAPLRSFWVAADPPVAFELWVDVSDLHGHPALCAFAVGEHAVAVERLGEDALCTLAHRILRDAGVARAAGEGPM